MKPENNQERNKAFGRFILCFAITVGLIAVAIFFGIRLPYVENNKLREQLAMVDSENVFQADFLSIMSQTQSLLDSVNKSSASAGLIDGRITQNIQTMDAMINNGKTSSKDLYEQIIRIMNLMQSDKASLRAAASKDSLVAMYNARIEELNTALSKWQEAYKQLETQNMILKQSK